MFFDVMKENDLIVSCAGDSKLKPIDFKLLFILMSVKDSNTVTINVLASTSSGNSPFGGDSSGTPEVHSKRSRALIIQWTALGSLSLPLLQFGINLATVHVLFDFIYAHAYLSAQIEPVKRYVNVKI
ncbi:hypothetical protein EVAR_30966_1 [Eumeta japonica]|uniref:Uncharacterized protein n=1 Tax=Eumeta variegata TaxID=151549 RepID=A0A4C1W9X7_EUMVA|nr:hypothetical protein EVAR_30966_1 [Eumeta japonica]